MRRRPPVTRRRSRGALGRMPLNAPSPGQRPANCAASSTPGTRHTPSWATASWMSVIDRARPKNATCRLEGVWRRNPGTHCISERADTGLTGSIVLDEQHLTHSPPRKPGRGRQTRRPCTGVHRSTRHSAQPRSKDALTIGRIALLQTGYSGIASAMPSRRLTRRELSGGRRRRRRAMPQIRPFRGEGGTRRTTTSEHRPSIQKNVYSVVLKVELSCRNARQDSVEPSTTVSRRFATSPSETPGDNRRQNAGAGIWVSRPLASGDTCCPGSHPPQLTFGRPIPRRHLIVRTRGCRPT